MLSLRRKSAGQQQGEAAGEPAGRGQVRIFPGKRKAAAKRRQDSLTSSGAGQIQNQSRQSQQNDDKDQSVAVQKAAEFHKPLGGQIHFRTQLGKYLIEYRKDSGYQDSYYCKHHQKHDHGIGDGVSDGFGNACLPLIEGSQRVHDLVQLSGLFSEPAHSQKIRRKYAGRFQGGRKLPCVA